MKSLKLFGILSSTVIVGGFSTLTILATSCGGETNNLIDLSTIFGTQTIDFGYILPPIDREAVINMLREKVPLASVCVWSEITIFISADYGSIKPIEGSKVYIGMVVYSFSNTPPTL